MVIITKKTSSFMEVLTICIVLWRMALTWLRTEHNYSNEEGEIHMTGWQFLGFGLVVSIVTFALSIQF